MLGRLFRRICIYITFFSWSFLIGLVGLTEFICYFTQSLPDHDFQLNHYTPGIISRFYSQDLDIIAEYAKERRILVNYNDIPKVVINAFLAAEDRHFFEHSGIDLLGILRAVVNNFTVARNGRLAGGSTITQQVVKNLILSDERSIDRKVKEAILAYRITRAYSKEKILELYLNHIFLGNNVYGIAMAAKSYFAKDLAELQIEEAAILAALPKAPSQLNPYNHYKKALARRNWVIERMLELGYINLSEAAKSLEKPINLASNGQVNVRANNIESSYYTQWVKHEITREYGEQALYEDGFSVHSCYDQQIQDYADIALRRGLINYQKQQGWHGPVSQIEPNNIGVSEDLPKAFIKVAEQIYVPKGYDLALITHFTKRGEPWCKAGRGKEGVLDEKASQWALSNNKLSAISGNRIGKISPQSPWKQLLKPGDIVVVRYLKNGRFSLETLPKVNGAMVVLEPYTGRVLAMVGGFDPRNDFFNRVTQAKRQPGSAFKTIVYLAALRKGYTPESKLLDAPITLSLGANKFWTPRNYKNKFLGEITLREAFARSCNSATIRLVMALGVKPITQMAVKMGVYESEAVKNANFSVAALGSLETTLLNMTNAFNIIASGGFAVKPKFIDAIYDKNGKILYKNQDIACDYCDLYDEAFTNSLKEKKSKRDNSAVTSHSVNAGLAATEEPDELVSKFNEDFALPPKQLESRIILNYSLPRLVPAQANEQILQMLREVVVHGSGVAARSLPWPVAGKTGTTNDSNDVWFIGMSPAFVAGVYIGYDAPQTLGEKASGANLALPVFVDFMEKAMQPYDKNAVLGQARYGFNLGENNRGGNSLIDYSDAANFTEAGFIKSMDAAVVDVVKNGDFSGSGGTKSVEEQFVKAFGLSEEVEVASDSSSNDILLKNRPSQVNNTGDKSDSEIKFAEPLGVQGEAAECEVGVDGALPTKNKVADFSGNEEEFDENIEPESGAIGGKKSFAGASEKLTVGHHLDNDVKSDLGEAHNSQGKEDIFAGAELD